MADTPMLMPKTVSSVRPFLRSRFFTTMRVSGLRLDLTRRGAEEAGDGNHPDKDYFKEQSKSYFGRHCAASLPAKP
jgi:hypothetical protein